MGWAMAAPDTTDTAAETAADTAPDPPPSGTSDLLGGLNPVQSDAVTHADGPLLVVAGAGSGKTRVLTHRIAHLIRDRGVSPFEILAITFTNKAADEMKSRVAALVGPVAQKMWVSTFHSACVRILRRDADKLGFPRQFTIYDQADAVRLTGYVIRDLDLDTKRFPPRSIHAAISAAKNDGVEADAYAQRAGNLFERKIADVYREYQDRLRRAGAMDFDDLLGQALRLLREHPDVLAHYQRRFQHILVDEYQDTNRVQNELVLLLAADHRNVCVVGDQDQSIYAFRGADIRNIVEFEDAFPDATVVVLEQNYRSTQTILDAANAVIANNVSRKPKELWTDQGLGDPIVRYHADDEGDEAQWITREIARLHDGTEVTGPEGDPEVGRRRRLLPHQRPEPGDGGAAHAGRHPLQGGGRHPLLRPPGDQGRHRLPAGRGQPGRRGVAQAGHQRAEAGGRRHLHRPARRLGHRPRPVVRRRAPPGRRRRGGRQGGDRHRGLPRPARRRGRPGRPAARGRCCSSCWSGRATSTSWRPSARSRPRAGWRTSPSWSVRRARPRRWTSSWSRSAWWPTPTTSTTTRRRSCS